MEHLKFKSFSDKIDEHVSLLFAYISTARVQHVFLQDVNKCT